MTLAGARRKLADEGRPAVSEETDLEELDELIGSDVRERLMLVKQGLRELKTMLSASPGTGARPEPFQLKQPSPKSRMKEKTKGRATKATKRRAS